MTTKLPLVLFALAGCPGPSGNPAVLWLAPDQGETHVKLIDHEPPPF
jgi:hypothetical protein